MFLGWKIRQMRYCNYYPPPNYSKNSKTTIVTMAGHCTCTGQRDFFYLDSASTVTKNLFFFAFSLELLDRLGPDFDKIVVEV